MSERLILFVEDDPTLQLVGKMALRNLGYKCEIAATGEKVLARDLSDILLIFMDVGLPGIDGRETAKLIRKKEVNENLRRIPIVALTGHAIREQCLESGMDDFLQKPALMEDLGLMIEKWAPETP
ncbi:hypothetical protein BH11CYA1_BH11CYA1_13970 [soil metagenome]